MDPQPTLSAVGIRYPDGSLKLIKHKLCTSKKNKMTQMNTWLNKTPHKISNHLIKLFEDHVSRDDPVFFCIEGQMKSKATVALESFIKGFMSVYFADIIVISYPAKTWQSILDERPDYRKSYERETLAEIHDHNTELVVIDEIADTHRNHDIVDAYLMIKFVLKRHFNYQ